MRPVEEWSQMPGGTNKMHAPSKHEAAAPADQPGLLAPDTSGMNFYRADPALTDLLRIHLPDALFRHIEPHLDRLGGLAGGHLDECARLADRHVPVLHQRDRFGRDAQWIEYHPAYRELEKAAFGEFGIHAMSLRKGIMGWPEKYPVVAKHAFTFLFNQAEFGLGCPINVTDGCAKAAVEFRQCGAEGKISRRPDANRHEQADPGRPVHDREGRRLRRRHADDDSRAGRRSLAADRRKMVLLQCRRRSRDAAGAAGRRGRRHPRRRPVPDAAPARGRLAQSLPDRAAEGQARHPLDGLGRDQAGRRDRLCGRQARSRLRADGRDGQFVAAVQRRQIHRADAPRVSRRDDGGAKPRGVRAAASSTCRWRGGN